MITQAELTTLWIGDAARPEFVAAANVAAERTRVTVCRDCDEAAAWLARHDPPEIIVLAHQRPGRFSCTAIERLRRLVPLSRMVALLGSWCEGETRTGDPCPGVQRIFWYDWPLQWRRGVEALLAGRCPRWGLPLTASSDEPLLMQGGMARQSRNGLVVVAARHYDTAEALLAACRSEGYAGVWRAPHVPLQLEGALAAIWSGTDCRPGEADQLRRLAEELPGLPIAALLSFPRVEDTVRAGEAGAAAVFSKPVWLDDLWDWLGALSWRRCGSLNEPAV
ncbi:MAG: hypothetical protein WDZ59_00300 [Pirellulales bacterium]